MTRLTASRTDRAATRRGRLVRVLAAVWLALYVLAVGATPIVDAMAGHGQEVVAHWEDASDDRCPPRHDEVGCQFAPVFASGGLVAPTSAVVAHWQLVAAPRPLEAAYSWGSAQRAVPSTRGPPAV